MPQDLFPFGASVGEESADQFMHSKEMGLEGGVGRPGGMADGSRCKPR